MNSMKKILIIEDDVFLGEVLSKKLLDEGYDAILVKDGKEGFEKIAAVHPDLILLDIILPTMNGYDILEKKLADPMIAAIPVIIISNSGQPVEINRALALGVKDYLVKAQFDPEEILIKVRAQLRKDPSEDTLSAEAKQKQIDSAHLDGKKVMWVEDDQFLNDIIAHKLSKTTFAFFHASEGEEALRIISQEVPDIIMLDIILSGMDGFEILRRIKSDDKIKHIPVILLSNLGQQSDLDKGKDLGAIRFLVKATVTPDEIIDQIKDVLTEAGK